MLLTDMHFHNHAYYSYNTPLVISPSQKVMNDFQAAAYNAHKDDQYFLAHAPCGSGKTLLQIWLAVHDVMSSGFRRKQLILTPQSHIGREFAKDDVTYNGHCVNWKVGRNLCEGDAGSLQRLKDFLLTPVEKFQKYRDDEMVTGINCVATHQAFALVWKSFTQAQQIVALLNLTLRIDEAHHIKNAYSEADLQGFEFPVQAALELDATFLGRACRIAMENSPSTKIHLTTATFYRGDERSIFTPSLMQQFKVHVYSWVDFWKTTGIEDVYIQYQRYDQDDPLDHIIQAVAEEQDRHHLIILPRKGKGVRNDCTVPYLINGLNERFGGRILDLTNPRTQEAGKKLLRSHPDEFRVVLSCALFNEGTNWRPCNRIHNLDCERSAMLAVQRLGRGFREYPGKRDLKVTYYVHSPSGDIDALKEAFGNHTTAIAIGMHMDDLFAPEMLPSITQPLAQTKEKGIALSDLFRGNHQEAYKELIKRLESMQSPEEAPSMIASVVDEYADLDLANREDVIRALERKVIRHFARSIGQTSIAIDDIKENWRLIWEKVKGESVVMGKLTLANMQELKEVLKKKREALWMDRFRQVLHIAQTTGLDSIDRDHPLFYWVKEHKEALARYSHE